MNHPMTVLSQFFISCYVQAGFQGKGMKEKSQFVREGNVLVPFAGIHSTVPGIQKGLKKYVWNDNLVSLRGKVIHVEHNTVTKKGNDRVQPRELCCNQNPCSF